MDSDILAQHKQLADELEQARLALKKAEESFLAHEAKLRKAVRENPLMQHIGLVGPESDLSDYIGSELTSERLSFGSDAPQEILPKKGRSIDPSFCKVLQEEPDEQFFITSPYLELSGSLQEFTQESLYELTKEIRNLDFCGCRVPITGSRDFMNLAPEDSMRATLALYAAGICIWDWDAITGEVYTCPHWERIIGKPEIASPIEMLTYAFDALCVKAIEKAMISLSEAESDTFCLSVHVNARNKKAKDLQLHGICVRDDDNEMVRILISANEVEKTPTSKEKMSY